MTSADIAKYLQMYDQCFRQKPKEMYYGKYLKSIRMFRSDSSIYIAARVWAEMKKHCIYTIDIKFDCHNVIEEAQCECTAGMAPDAHCKHVAVVLFALSKGRQGILTEET